MTIDDKFNHLKDYIKFRIDIVSNNPDWWLGMARNELPTFDYYLKNCVEDKAGKYDFTKRMFKTCTMQMPIIKDTMEIIEFIQKKTTTRIEFSIWMGTPFNFKEIITTK